MNHLSILITDDDEDDCLFLRQAIERNTGGAIVIEAHNGEQALKCIAKQADRSGFGLIILDINMPGMSGLEVLDEVRSRPSLKNIPVIMLSTSGSADEISVAYKKGVNSYIQKPNSYTHYDEIAKAIKTCFTDALFSRVPDFVSLSA